MRSIQIPLNRTVLKTQPVASKRVAPARRPHTNRRKLQARPGQIVYVIRNGYVQPMRVVVVDDCFVWSKGAKWQERKGYMIYYDLQPLVYKMGKWYAQPYRAQARKSWREYNKWLIKSGWVGHSLDMSEFALTCAEANWMLMLT